jgi:hypothetical protein
MLLGARIRLEKILLVNNYVLVSNNRLLMARKWVKSYEIKGSTSYFYALQPCADGTWCCNNLSSTSCCKNNQGDFAFNLTSLSLGQSQKSPTSTLTVTSGVATVTSSSTCSVSAGSEKTCPADKSTVIGASVGAILGTLLIVSLCALFFVSRRLREQGQKHVDSDTGMAGEWRTELDATKGVMKYEIDGREVRHP